MTMTSQVSFSGNAEIDGVLDGTKWALPSLTYSFVPERGTTSPLLNTAQQDAVRQVLGSVDASTNLTFSQVAETSQSQGILRFGESANQITASAYMPSENALGGDVSFNTSDYNSPKKGSYAFATFLHEAGHALGLDHGQDGDYKLPFDHDSLEYSVMTYRSYVGAPLDGYTAHDGSYPRSYMLADLAALQYLYGANYGTNAGNTTYQWSPSTGELKVNGVSSAKSTTNTVFETIWDGAGPDTYDSGADSTGPRVSLSRGGLTPRSSGRLAQLGTGPVARSTIASAWLYGGKPASLVENARGGYGA